MAPNLKRLRAHDEGTHLLDVDALEDARCQATGLFNQMAILWHLRLLPEDLFRNVLSPRSAALWVQFVAPLDRAIRVKRGGDEVHPLELFYAAYAKGHLLTKGKP